MTRVLAKCSRCDDELEGEEVSSPYDDGDGGILCDDCYHEHYEFDCCRCCEGEHIDHRGGIGDLIVVFDKSAGVKRGIYEVIKHPYFTASVLGDGWLHSDALKRVKGDMSKCRGNGYPVGHLCQQCATKVREQKMEVQA